MIDIRQTGQNSATFVIEGPATLASATWAQLPHGRLRTILGSKYTTDLHLLEVLAANGIMVTVTGSWREPAHHWWSVENDHVTLHIDSTAGYHVILRVAVSYSAAD